MTVSVVLPLLFSPTLCRMSANVTVVGSHSNDSLSVKYLQQIELRL